MMWLAGLRGLSQDCPLFAGKRRGTTRLPWRFVFKAPVLAHGESRHSKPCRTWGQFKSSSEFIKAGWMDKYMTFFHLFDIHAGLRAPAACGAQGAVPQCRRGGDRRQTSIPGAPGCKHLQAGACQTGPILLFLIDIESQFLIVPLADGDKSGKTAGQLLHQCPFHSAILFAAGEVLCE